MVSQYTPDQLVSLTYDSEGFEQLIKDEEMDNNHLKSDIEAIKNKIRKIQKETDKLELETKKGLEKVNAGNK